MHFIFAGVTDMPMEGEPDINSNPILAPAAAVPPLQNHTAAMGQDSPTQNAVANGTTPGSKGSNSPRGIHSPQTSDKGGSSTPTGNGRRSPPGMHSPSKEGSKSPTGKTSAG